MIQPARLAGGRRGAPHPGARGSKWRVLAARCALRAFRVVVLSAIVTLMHAQHARHRAADHTRALSQLMVEDVRRFYPSAALLAALDLFMEDRAVLDDNGKLLGRVLQSSPLSDGVVGFSGPTNALIAVDALGVVLGVDVLSSGDTVEHVDRVRNDRDFLPSFRGLRLGDPPPVEVDGVSGATLTSLAIAEGVIARLGGQRPSYRFPEPPEIESVRVLLRQSASIRQLQGRPGLYEVIGPEGRLLGNLLRTSPTADDLVGYQGPTDTWIALEGGLVTGVILARSYDNPPYVRWVSEEDRFFRTFRGRSLNELAGLDLAEAGVEGVSGATMTSQSVAAGIVAAARAATAKRRDGSWPDRIAPRPRDIGTFAIVFAGLWIAFTRLRGRKLLRRSFQVALVGYLGFLQGDMISQALLVGWAREGVPWHLASGLVLLTAVALLTALLGGRPVYCHQLCPHGAAQELLKRRLRWRLGLSRRVEAVVRWIPPLTLLIVVAAAFDALDVELVSIEPFHAYLVTVAGWATLAIAVGGLVVSLVLPMAYCRYGCPTGALLKYLGPRGATFRFTRADLVATVGLLLGAVLYAAGAP